MKNNYQKQTKATTMSNYFEVLNIAEIGETSIDFNNAIIEEAYVKKPSKYT